MATPTASQEIRFREYSLDVRTGELRRSGTLLKLQPQPAKVLSILVSRAGEMVTRQELADRVWGSETYVDFEHGLNYAIQQIRTVLEDDPKEPRFLETIPKRGYRFIVPVTNHTAAERAELPAVEALEPPRSRHTRTRLVYLTVTTVVLVVVAAAAWLNVRTRLSTASTGRIQSIAVLPLRNLSNDPEQEFFSDGMTDELITDLAKFGELRVISHTSVERYKNTKTPLPQVAKELGVDAIVEGTVMRSAGRVRIAAQLIDARSDKHLWADSYGGDLRDVFSLQEEVARRIATEIGTNLGARRPRSASKTMTDPAAHEAYLRGTFYWNQLTCEGFAKGREYFQQAIDKDPNFAPAYVGLARSYFTLADWGCSPDRELVAKSRAAALKALELDPESGEAHTWLGSLAFFYEWDFPKAESELKRAIELSPNYPEGHMAYAVFLLTTGRRDLGLAEMTSAHAIDPLSHLSNVLAIFVFYLARQYDTAIEQGEKTVELHAGSVGAYHWLGAAYEKRGLYDQAVAAYLKEKELAGVSPEELATFRLAYQKSGIHGFWRKQLESAEKGPRNTCWITRIHAHLGEREQTLQYLERSVQQHCSGPHVVIADPIYDDVRQDPRFKQLLARLHL